MATPRVNQPVQAPPDLPAMPGVSDTLTQYLRTLALWCRNGFADKLSGSVAQPWIMLQAVNAAVFRIGVDNQGRLTSTPLALGSGDPGAPVLTFAPVTGSSAMAAPTPAGTSSASFVMMGLGLTTAAEADAPEQRLAPLVSTRALVTIDGTISNNTNNGQSIVQLYYGTGTPPGNGAPATGTAVGLPQTYQASSGGSLSPFSLTSVIGGLAPGTSYWFDLALRVSAGIGTVSNVVASYVGLP